VQHLLTASVQTFCDSLFLSLLQKNSSADKIPECDVFLIFRFSKYELPSSTRLPSML